MHVYPRESSIPSDSVRASIDTCININLENEREGRKEKAHVGRGSKIKEVRSVCSTRIPAARQSFRELSPTPPRGIELRIRSSLSLPLPRILPSTFLEKSSSKFRGEGNFSRIFLLSTSPIIRGNRFRADPVLRAEFRFIGNRWPIAGRSPTINGESVPRFTITKQILISRLPSIVQGRFTPFPPRKATDEMVVEGKIDYPECSEIQKA